MNSTRRTAQEEHQWQAAISQYDELIRINAQRQVDKMTDSDVDRHNDLNNTPGAGRPEIVEKIISQNRLHRSAHLQQSPLMNRLIDGKPGFEHTPPTSFGHTWHELVDEANTQTRFPCFVKLFGIGRREKDKENNIWLFDINGCLWECRTGTDNGLQLIQLDHLWAMADVKDRAAMWVDVKTALKGPISYEMHYGKWPRQFSLQLLGSEPDMTEQDTIEAIDVFDMPFAKDIFGLTRSASSFPLAWNIVLANPQ